MVTLGVFKLGVGVDAGEVEDVEASPGLWEVSEPTLVMLAFSFFSASLVETNTLFFAVLAADLLFPKRLMGGMSGALDLVYRECTTLLCGISSGLYHSLNTGYVRRY